MKKFRQITIDVEATKASINNNREKQIENEKLRDTKVLEKNKTSLLIEKTKKETAKTLNVRYDRKRTEAACRYNSESKELDALAKNKTVEDIITEREIQYLVHFTQSENIESILKHGIVPVGQQSFLNISSRVNDVERYDFMTNCSNFTISFPNYRMFFSLRQSKISEWAVFFIDIQVMLSMLETSYCCRTNAASHVDTPHVNPRTFMELFRKYHKTKDGKIIERSHEINNAMTTDPQAEILLGSTVPPKYIRAVCFEENITSTYHSLIPKDMIVNSQKCFTPRTDYELWQEEGLRG